MTQALAGHGGETIALTDFCELLDASVAHRAGGGGPTAHLFAPVAGRSAAGAGLAAEAAAARKRQENESEERELTFRPKIDENSEAIARERMGRDATKVGATHMKPFLVVLCLSSTELLVTKGLLARRNKPWRPHCTSFQFVPLHIHCRNSDGRLP